jgi:hypothetical protein
MAETEPDNLDAEADAVALTESEQEIEAARSELDDLRAKLRARTAQLKAEAEARQLSRAEQQTNEDVESTPVVQEAAEAPTQNEEAPETAISAEQQPAAVPVDEAAMMAAWEAELAGAGTEGPESDGDAEKLWPDIEAERSVSTELTAEEQAEAEMMAAWEAELSAGGVEPDDDQSQIEDRTAASDPDSEEADAETDSVEADIPLSDSLADMVDDVALESDSEQGLSEQRAAEITDKERAEQEAEAQLAAAWEGASDASVEMNQTQQLADEIEQPEDIDTGPPVALTDAKSALSEMWDDLTEEPLPSDQDLDQMFKEIRELDQQTDSEAYKPVGTAAPRKRDDLHSILSSIPSFSEMNKKPRDDS